MFHRDSQIESDHCDTQSWYTWSHLITSHLNILESSHPLLRSFVPNTSNHSLYQLGLTLPHMKPPYFNKLTLCQMLIPPTPNT